MFVVVVVIVVVVNVASLNTIQTDICLEMIVKGGGVLGFKLPYCR